MSRSGYTDDFEDDLALGRWRGVVASATRGKRGQKLFRDLLAALDAMPDKALIVGELEEFNPEDGRMEVCALGALGHARGIDMSNIDPEDPPQVAAAFDITEPLALEIAYMNDEYFDFDITPEKRWQKMRSWVARQIMVDTPSAGEPKP